MEAPVLREHLCPQPGWPHNSAQATLVAGSSGRIHQSGTVAVRYHSRRWFSATAVSGASIGVR
jgi:hypothetical protein